MRVSYIINEAPTGLRISRILWLAFHKPISPFLNYIHVIKSDIRVFHIVTKNTIHIFFYYPFRINYRNIMIFTEPLEHRNSDLSSNFTSIKDPKETAPSFPARIP